MSPNSFSISVASCSPAGTPLSLLSHEGKIGTPPRQPPRPYTRPEPRTQWPGSVRAGNAHSDTDEPTYSTNRSRIGRWDSLERCTDSAESGAPDHRGVDQGGQQSGVIHSGDRPHPGIHRDWCEAGHRVDLVDGQRAVGPDEEVDPSKALAVQRTEGAHGHRPQCGGDVVVELGWDIELARVVEILGVEVVPARGVRGHHADLRG